MGGEPNSVGMTRGGGGGGGVQAADRGTGMVEVGGVRWAATGD
jgi:hypothetical protein